MAQLRGWVSNAFETPRSEMANLQGLHESSCLWIFHNHCSLPCSLLTHHWKTTAEHAGTCPTVQPAARFRRAHREQRGEPALLMISVCTELLHTLVPGRHPAWRRPTWLKEQRFGRCAEGAKGEVILEVIAVRWTS